MKIAAVLIVGIAIGFTGAFVALDSSTERGEDFSERSSVKAERTRDSAVAELEEQVRQLKSELAELRESHVSQRTRAPAAEERQIDSAQPGPEVVAEASSEGVSSASTQGGRVPVAEGAKLDRWGMPVGEKLSPEQILTLVQSENPRDQIRGLRALADYPDRDEAIGLAKGLLEGGQPWLRLQAMETIAELTETGASPMIAPLLEDDVSWVARSAARKLGDLGDTSAIAPLQQAYETGEGRVKLESALSLQKLGDSGPVHQLAQDAIIDFGSDDGDRRATAINTLSSLKDISYNVQFVNALNDSNSRVRINAARALASQGTSSEIPALTQLTNDPVSDVAETAKRAINFIQNPNERDRERNFRWGGD